MKESFRSLRWSWVGLGWFLSAALASLIFLAMDAFGVVGTGRPADSMWISAAMMVGFFVTGFFVGTRVVAAPILHGVAIGLTSLVVWFLANLFFGEPLGQTTWNALGTGTIAEMLLLQIVAAVLGARIGVRWMREPVAA